MPFPPVPTYPVAIDTDYNLFLVYNTTESRLCTDNSAWSEEIEIIPVGEDDPEIWADNGFGNLEGEMFYYDSVEKNIFGKVNKLKGCARNLGGTYTKYNSKGSWVRGYVVAEHHNQLVQAILNTEDFIGVNFDERTETLDWRIRNLQGLPVIFDDWACPDVNFTFDISENDPETGILATYNLEITPPGSISNFRLDFGDEEFTTTDLSGTHRYALNSRIDPVVTVSNDKCQMIQTPIERDNPAEPPSQIEEGFDIEIPEVPNFPDFTVVPCEVPEPEINLPPIVFPCLSLDGLISGLPSIILGPDINMVSNIVIHGPDNPVQILHSVVTIEGGFEIPSIIFVDVPPTIVIDPPIPPTIVVVAPSTITMGMLMTDVPKIEVDWGTPPELEITLTTVRPVGQPTTVAAQNQFGDEFADIFESANKMSVSYEPVGFPSEIMIIAPTFPELRIDASAIPSSILLDATEVVLPDRIEIFGPENPIPTRIDLVGDIPHQIELVGKDFPTKVDLVFVGEPIQLQHDLPERILIEQLQPLPDKILLELKEFPSTIQVIGFPEGIPLLFPSEADMPKMELVYKGSPLEVKITMDSLLSENEDGTSNPCFQMIPCKR